MASKLTDLQVRSAPARAKKYKISAGRGLTLVVMPDGAKYWRLRYRFAGKPKEISLGRPYPEVSLKSAALEADRMRLLLADGIDPAEQRMQQKLQQRNDASSTFGVAANAWFEFRSKAWAKRTSAQVQDYLIKDVIPALGRRPLAAITTKELAVFTGGIESRGAPDVAKKARQWLASIFAFARANGWTDKDPVRDLRAVVLPSNAGKHYAHLRIEELPEFLIALDRADSSPLVKAATMLVLWTANRPGVTRTLRWSELDLDAGLWTIAKDREGMKRGYLHYTPLPRQAVEKLKEVHTLTGTFEYVFAGRNNPRQPLSDGAINGLLKRLGYRGRQTTHGFRHLISTALNERGFEADWVERQLAHGDPDKIRGTYNKAMYLDPRREMMQSWADYLDQLRATAISPHGRVIA